MWQRLPSARAALAVAIVTQLAGVSHAAAQQSRSAECDVRTTGRVVAIGDVHGAYDRFVAILGAAGLVDERARWRGGRAILVQTGDVVDRGPDSRRVLDLLRRLEREASRAGGRVYALVGNHEQMRLMSLWRDVSAAEFAAFRTPDSEEVRQRLYDVLSAESAKQARAEGRPFDAAAYREQFMRDIPLGFIEMRHAFSPAADYGKWLRERPAMVRINGVVFVHGGISPTTAALGCEGINGAVRSDLRVTPPPAPDQLQTSLAGSEAGPLWYRGLAEAPDPGFAPEVTAILGRLDARAIVMGHTPVATARITPRFDARVIQIDTGMLGGPFYPDGVASALEIQGDVLTAIYQTGREMLAHLPAAR